MSVPPIAFEWRPLTEPVDPRAARDHERMLRAQGRIPATLSRAALVAITVVVLVLIFGVFGVMLVPVAIAMIASGVGLLAIIPVVILLAVIAIVVVVVVAVMRGGGTDTRRYRLDRFAVANGMAYVPSIPAPALPGVIFQHGSARQATDLVRGTLPRFVEFGNYAFTTGSGKNSVRHRWGYVAVKLDVPLPHIVLDAQSNNGLFGASNLPASFDRDQALSLEGDFDRYFSLYCPPDYERDALYLFTPDIMARFIDNAATLDVEIVDDWLFLYAKRDLSTLDPATWGWLFTVIAALLDKFAQWSRWRDERLELPRRIPAMPDAVASGIPGATAGPVPAVTPPPVTPAGVAPPGRRLQQRIPWVAIVAVLVVTVLLVIAPIGVFGAFISSFTSP